MKAMWVWFIMGVMWLSAGMALMSGGYALYVYFKNKRIYAKSFEFAKNYMPNRDDCKGDILRFVKILTKQENMCLHLRATQMKLADEAGLKYSMQDLKDPNFLSRIIEAQKAQDAKNGRVERVERVERGEIEEKPKGRGLISEALDFVKKENSKLRDDGAQVMLRIGDPTRFTFKVPNGSYSGGIPTACILGRTTWKSVKYISNNYVLAITHPDSNNYNGIGVFDVEKSVFVWSMNYRTEAGGSVNDAIPMDSNFRSFRIIYTRADGTPMSFIV